VSGVRAWARVLGQHAVGIGVAEKEWIGAENELERHEAQERRGQRDQPVGDHASHRRVTMLCSVRGAVLPVEDTTDRLSTQLAMGATLGSPAEEPMKPARSRLAVATSCFSIALLAASAVAQAGNLFTASSSGPLFAFGGSGVLVFAWSQETVYFNIDITATLADTTPGGPIPGTQGVVYLTTSFGPGTTPANNAAPPVTVSGLKGFFEPRRLLGTRAQRWHVLPRMGSHEPHAALVDVTGSGDAQCCHDGARRELCG